MAIHFTPIKTAPYSASSPARPAATASAGRTMGTVRQPETAPQQSFRTVATAAASDAQSSQASASTSLPSIVALFASGGSAVTAAQGAQSGAAAQTSAAPSAAPTAEDVFGSDPWMDNPTGIAPDGAVYNYNNQYFATAQTAASVAKMLGGAVVQVNEFTSAPGSNFVQQQPNEMVQLKSGALVNPGLVAGFYTHGYPQSMVDQMIANEVANVNANT